MAWCGAGPVGGRERTLDHYSALAVDAVLGGTEVHDITDRQVLIECVPTSA